MRPEFSVVIPVFNNVDSTLRAIESILAQSVPVLEIILVDDTSRPENVQDLHQRVAALNSAVEIRIKPQPQNIGPGLARHVGAQLARGAFVAFLDADDVWHRDKIAQVCQVIDQMQADCIGHDRAWSFDITEDELTRLPAQIDRKELRRLDFLKRNPIPTSSIVVAVEIGRDMFRFGGRKSEDYMALMLAARKARKIVYIDAPLAWAPKPPFGLTGEGADQAAIYRHSVAHMARLWRQGLMSSGSFLVFLGFFCLRAPVGMARFMHYKWKFKNITEGREQG